MLLQTTVFISKMGGGERVEEEEERREENTVRSTQKTRENIYTGASNTGGSETHLEETGKHR